MARVLLIPLFQALSQIPLSGQRPPPPRASLNHYGLGELGSDLTQAALDVHTELGVRGSVPLNLLLRLLCALVFVGGGVVGRRIWWLASPAGHSTDDPDLQ